jgi:magnesium-transporting ATPase (P-type)
MRYAGATVAKLLACPFCREMFEAGEADACPSCGLALESVAKLPPSYEAELETELPEAPEWRTLPWWTWRRGRGALLLCAVAGAVLFFLPWIRVTIPDPADLSCFELSRRLGWTWACLVSWLTLIPTVLSRRSVAGMRGARAVAALFCAVPMVTALVLLLRTPSRGLVPLRFTYGVGLWATVVLALIALPFAVRFGGRLDHKG